MSEKQPKLIEWIFILAALVAIVGFIYFLIDRYKTNVQPKSGWLPKEIVVRPNIDPQYFDIDVENLGGTEVVYRLQLSSSFIQFVQDSKEQDPAFLDFTSHKVSLSPAHAHKHHIGLKNLYIPQEGHKFMKSNAFIELKIFEENKDGSRSSKPIYESKCYYKLSESFGVIEKAVWNSPMMDTTGNSDRQKLECKSL